MGASTEWEFLQCLVDPKCILDWPASEDYQCDDRGDSCQTAVHLDNDHRHGTVRIVGQQRRQRSVSSTRQISEHDIYIGDNSACWHVSSVGPSREHDG